MVQWSSRTSSAGVLDAVLTWHCLGALFGAGGLGVGTIAVSLFSRWNPEALLAGALLMTIAAFVMAVVLTPLAFLLLTMWIGLVRLLPSLEYGSSGYRIAKLSVVAIVMTVPTALVFMTVLGMRPTGETRPAIILAWAGLWKDWPVLFMYLPAAWGWFVLPRIVSTSLRGSIRPGVIPVELAPN